MNKMSVNRILFIHWYKNEYDIVRFFTDFVFNPYKHMIYVQIIEILALSAEILFENLQKSWFGNKI